MVREDADVQTKDELVPKTKPLCLLHRRRVFACRMTTKGFKVTDPERKFRVGIAAKSLEELKRKTIEKFKLSLPIEIQFQTPDGTLIENDDYFQTIDAQTLLVWSRQGERAQTDAELLYRTIREVNEEYLTAGEKVQEFFTEKMKNKVFKLAEVLRSIDRDKAKISSKEEHPEWFEGEFSLFYDFVFVSQNEHFFCELSTS